MQNIKTWTADRIARVNWRKVGRNSVVVGAVIAVSLGVTTAVANTVIPDSSITSAKLQNRAGVNTIDLDLPTLNLLANTKPAANQVDSSDQIKPDTIDKTDLNPALRAEVEEASTPGAPGKSYGCDGNVVDAEHPAAKCPGEEGAKGQPGDPATDVKGDISLKAAVAATVIPKIGGRFVENAVVIGEGTIPAGTWDLDVSGKFNRTVAAAEGAAPTRPMIQLQVDGKEICSIGGNDIAPSLDADLFGLCSGDVTVTEATAYKLYAFGYDDKRGSAGSGELTAAATLTGTRG